MSGFEVARRISQNPALRKVKVIMLTSAGQYEDVAALKTTGIAACLTKPARQSELLETIVKVLGAASGPKTRPPLHTPYRIRKARRSLRVLLAEDNPVNQEVALQLLKKRGHAVVLAGDGAQAVAALQKERFDAVLMDVQMPNMSGIEATRAIRDEERTTSVHVPIVAMTAHAMKGDRERCLEAGMDTYVSKPIQAEELFRTVEDVAHVFSFRRGVSPKRSLQLMGSIWKG